MNAGDGWIVSTIVLGVVCLALLIAIVYTFVQWYKCNRSLTAVQQGSSSTGSSRVLGSRNVYE